MFLSLTLNDISSVNIIFNLFKSQDCLLLIQLILTVSLIVIKMIVTTDYLLIQY